MSETEMWHPCATCEVLVRPFTNYCDRCADKRLRRREERLSALADGGDGNLADTDDSSYDFDHSYLFHTLEDREKVRRARQLVDELTEVLESIEVPSPAGSYTQANQTEHLLIALRRAIG